MCVDLRGVLVLPINVALLAIGLSRSIGWRRRVALAMLVVRRPRLWLLDEPYSNLDTEGVGLVDRLLLGHLEAGGSAVVATHGIHRPDWADTIDYVLVSGAAA